MVKLENGQILSYPVKLYFTAKRHLMGIFGCILIFLLGGFVTPIAQQDGTWLIVGVGWMLMIIGFLGFIILLLAWLRKKPTMEIKRTGLSFFHILKSNQQHLILWQDIKSLDLQPWTRGHFNHWMLTIHPKTGTSIRRPLKPMLYGGLMLNEKEIFYLIKQAFEGEPVLSGKAIKIKLDDRIEMNISFWFVIATTIISIGMSALVLL